MNKELNDFYLYIKDLKNNKVAQLELEEIIPKIRNVRPFWNFEVATALRAALKKIMVVFPDTMIWNFTTDNNGFVTIDYII